MAEYTPGTLQRRSKEALGPEQLLGKSLPTSIDAEKAVLSAILLDDQNLTLVSDILRSTDFYARPHQLIYQAVLDIAQANKKCDLLVLQDHLGTRKLLSEEGGIEYLMELKENITSM